MCEEWLEAEIEAAKTMPKKIIESMSDDDSDHITERRNGDLAADEEQLLRSEAELKTAKLKSEVLKAE